MSDQKSEKHESQKSQNTEQLKKAIAQINAMKTVIQQQHEQIIQQQDQIKSFDSKFQIIMKRLDDHDKFIQQTLQKQQQQQQYSASNFEHEMGENLIHLKGEVVQNQNAFQDAFAKYNGMQLPEQYTNIFK